MLHRAARQPLQPVAAANVSKPGSSTKRKFERTMSSSSLQHLQQHLSFNENGVDDDIHAAESPQLPPLPPYNQQQVTYPRLDPMTSLETPSGPPLTRQVQYPQIKPVQPFPSSYSGRPHQAPPSSSACEPWSSSPPSHLEPRNKVAPLLEPPHPAKRRTLPWGDEGSKAVNAIEEKIGEAPLPRNNSGKLTYLWNKSASALKDEQKEFRKRNKVQEMKESVEAARKPRAVTQGPIELSKEQRDVIKAVCEDGKSVFFTGSAGTGKSVLMRSIIEKLKHKYRRESDRLAITASTGLAACVIEGQTLHSWAGIGLGKEPAPELVKKIKRNPKTKTRWLRTKVLVVDEISMVDGLLFDKLEQIARIIRNTGLPFGGIQLVVTGDFFQLPPVAERNSEATFAFDAATWNTCVDHTILLTHVFRQKDPVFAGMLNEMRMGKLTPATVATFKSLSRGLDFDDDVEATELFPTRYEVENANNMRMRSLSGQPMTFDAVDSGKLEPDARERVLQNGMAPKSITLKKGAQVMLIKNIDTQLVNGSLGKIQSFMDETTFHVYKDNEEEFNLAQEPEGGSDEEEKAAAREKIRRLRLLGNRDVQPKYWPMVRFTLADGTCRDLLCQPEEWKTEDQQGEILAKRVQIPLILSWALSIHKAQGQTLNRVKVDLGKVFERGQAYVALSRATSQEGLQVLRFREDKVMVHPKVTAFYSKLVGADSLHAPKPVVNKPMNKPAMNKPAAIPMPNLQKEDYDDDDEDALEYLYSIS
ncbi:hypothetical protein DV735_g1273, partial [Chaetothyriales sp. CBS 134920]